MPLRSHNILALLTQIGHDTAGEKPVEESAAFLQLVGTESPWADIFSHIDSISDFALRHRLRSLEFDYTVAHVHNQIGHVLPRSGSDIWALERTSYLTGLFCDPFSLWDEYCAALDVLEVDLREELESRQLTPRRLKSRMDDPETVRRVIGSINTVLFENMGLAGEEGAINRLESHSAPLVLCERVRGIPLSLAVIYLIAANRLGFPLYGVNTPGRFLIKWQLGELEFFIDVFDRGSIISRQNLEALIAANLNTQATRLLEAAPFEVMTRRALANLIALALRAADNDRARKLEALSRALFGF